VATLGAALWLGLTLPQDQPDKEPVGGPVKSVQELRRDLGDQRLEVRRVAAKGLADLGPGAEPATGELIAALRDPDRVVQAQAVEALEKIGDRMGPHALLPLIDGLRDEEPGVRQRSIIVLVAMGKKAIPALEAALGVHDTHVHQGALTALVRNGAAAVPALIKSLKDQKNGKLRRRAAQALGEIGPPARTALPALEKALGDSSERVRQTAAAAMKKIDPRHD
jgi:HEAT repeat protein